MDKLTHSQKVRWLYKAILKLHKATGLPHELSELGTKYVKDEFRRHLQCTPMEAQLFMTEWAKYAATLSKQLGLKGKPYGKLGDNLDVDTVKLLKDDQVVQLYELMLAAKNIKEEEVSK